MYNTVEAILDKNKVIFKDWYNFINKKTKILITFIEENNDFNLYELDKKNITKDLIDWKIKISKKDKSLFTNI